MTSKLTLLNPTNKRSSNGGVIWKCQCECGKISFHEGHRVRRNIIKSCGCGRKTKDVDFSAQKSVYNMYKYNAKKRGYQFCLTLEEFIELISTNCFYCGQKPSNTIRGNFSTYSNGIDRLDNNKGYYVDNCVAACTKCNHAKGTSSAQDFFDWIESIYKFKKGTLW